MFRLATSSDLSDRDLVDRCLSINDRTAQRSAQRLLYERYKRAMFSTAYRITNDYNNANDALQDAFVTVFRSLDQFAFQSTLGAWIKTIVVRKAIRKQQVESRFISIDETIHDQPVPLPEGLTGAELDAVIRTLPDGARTVFLLAEVEGYAHKEIADLLEITEGTSKSQLSYARRILRQRLSHDY
jgi:RNA polymerase sigma-70 factor (ECF subfamily)